MELGRIIWKIWKNKIIYKNINIKIKNIKKKQIKFRIATKKDEQKLIVANAINEKVGQNHI